MNNDRDQDLIKNIANKSLEHMEVFYRCYENIVYRFALKKLNNEADASDIVNMVMMEVWNTASRFEGKSQVKTWLFSITHHRIIDLIRKRKVNHDDDAVIETIPDLRAEANMEKVVEASQTQDFIGECMNKLSGKYQQILELLFYQEASYEEMASILSCSIGTVKSRIFNAKKLLKHCLEMRLRY